MKNTIEALWHGDLAPCDQCGSHDATINRLLIQMEQKREHLCGTLTQEQKSAFDQYIDLRETYLLRLMERAFCDGFSLASRLLVEAMAEGA